MQIVKDGNISHEFPDDATPEEIESILNSSASAPQQTQPQASSLPPAAQVVEKGLNPENVADAMTFAPISKAAAFGAGAARGAMNVGLELGDLAADILKNFDATKGAGDKLKGLVKSGQEYNQPGAMEALSPIGSGLGNAVGYGAGYMLGPQKLIRGGEAALSTIPELKALGQAMPNTVTGGLREMLSGGITGAAIQPENRITGALTGGIIGGATGAVGGATSAGFQQGQKDMAPMFNTAGRLDFDLSSPQAIASARKELADRGAGQLRQDIQDRAVSKAEQQIATIKPESVTIPQKSPSRLLAARAAKNFPEVEARMQAAYAPLDESGVTVATTPIKTTKRITNYLPEKALPKNATFSQLQQYRQELDISIRAAKSQLSPKEIGLLKSRRDEITSKLEEVSEKAGLGQNFTTAEDIYKNEYRPFLTFSSTGKVNTRQATDETWSEINTLLNQKNPEPKKLRALIKVLGDEGKDLVGWAGLQNAFSQAKIGNEVSLQTFQRNVNKLSASGLDSIIAKPEYRKTVNGITNIIQDGKAASKIKTNRVYIPIITPVVEHLMETEAGIKLLMKLGGSDRKSKAYRQAIQQLVTQGINIPLNYVQRPSEKTEIE